MARFGRLGAAGGVVLAATFVLAGPAGADTPEAYAGSAAGQALTLAVSVNGQGTPAPLTFGISDAAADSNLNAKADAAGELLQGTLQTAKVQGNGSQQNPQQCGPLSLPNSAPFTTLGLSLSTGCSTSVAQVTNSQPSATGSGLVAGLDLNASTPLNATPLGTTLNGVLSTVLNALPGGNPVTDPLKTTLSTVLSSVLNTKTLSVTVGSSTSSVNTVASTVTSTATAQGAVIKVLPNPTASLTSSTPISSDPLVTITVGQASATAVYNRQTGKSTDSFSPALVTIHFNPDLAKNVSGLPTDITVPVNQTQVILAGTPLESKIIVGDGSTVTNPDGSVGATADGVRLELLRDPGDTSGKTPLLTLSLAHAQAGVGGSPAVVTPPVVPAVPAAELPRTGGSPWIPAAGVGVAVLAVAARRARRSYVRSEA